MKPSSDGRLTFLPTPQTVSVRIWNSRAIMGTDRRWLDEGVVALLFCSHGIVMDGRTDVTVAVAGLPRTTITKVETEGASWEHLANIFLGLLLGVVSIVGSEPFPS